MYDSENALSHRNSTYSIGISSVESPHWLVKYAKSHVFGAFEANFCEKLKIAPPHKKTAPLKRLNSGLRPKNQTQFRRRPFFFFFWRPPNFERKKPSNLRAFREISSKFSDNPSETDSRTMKIRVKVVCTFLTLSK